MLILGYGALMGLGLLLSAPWWLVRMAATERYREGLRERLGVVPARLLAAVAGKRVVWVHAVSVGEVLAVSRLVQELETALHEASGGSSHHSAWTFIVSTTTGTGQAMARARFGTERVFYFPLDFGFAVRPYLRALRPALLLLTESELWPRLLHECEAAEVPVAVANARISDRSFRRALRVRKLWKRVLGKVTLWLAQSDEDARRLLTLGADPGAVEVAGNLKYDLRAMGETPMSRRLGPSLSGARLVLAGSTLEGEEAQFLALWPELHRAFPQAVLLLAPRHPDRFERVADAIRGSGYPFFRCSELLSHAEPLAGGAILLLDTIGDLAAMYGLAEVAFVGGSLVQKGGHNPLEPARFGIPVLMGPSFENFRDIVAKMGAGGGIRILRNRGELSAALTDLLGKPEAARAMGERGLAVFNREGGATARSVAALLPMLQEAAQDEGPKSQGPEHEGRKAVSA